MLTKGMTEMLRTKIYMAKGKISADHGQWSYEKLKTAIQKYAVTKEDPTTVIKKFIKPPWWRIDEQLVSINEIIEAITRTSKI